MGWIILIIIVYFWARSCEDEADRKRAQRHHRTARGLIVGKALWDLHNIDKNTRL